MAKLPSDPRPSMTRLGHNLGELIAGLKSDGYADIVSIESRLVTDWREVPIEPLVR